MFGIGGFEFFLICLVGLLIFGPDKMPEIGRTIGRTMRQFTKVQDDMKRVVTAEMYAKDPQKETSPFKPKESILKSADDDEEEPIAVKEPSSSQAASLYGLAKSSDDQTTPGAEPASTSSTVGEGEEAGN